VPAAAAAAAAAAVAASAAADTKAAVVKDTNTVRSKVKQCANATNLAWIYMPRLVCA
jgi:hypothetical protein